MKENMNMEEFPKQAAELLRVGKPLTGTGEYSLPKSSKY